MSASRRHLHASSPRGSARERTELAWNRSGLAVLVSVAALVRHLWPFDSAPDDAALAIVIAGALLWVVAALVFTRSAARWDRHTSLRPQVFGLMTAATLTLVVAGVLATFLSPT